jgi:hypothetical protein
MTGIERGLEMEQAGIRANGHTLNNLPSCAGHFCTLTVSDTGREQD